MQLKEEILKVLEVIKKSKKTSYFFIKNGTKSEIRAYNVLKR